MAPKKQEFNQFEKDILQSLEGALAHARGKKKLKVTMIRVPDRPPLFTAERIIALRSKLKLSQQQLAEFLNARVRTVAQWEKGIQKPAGPAARLLQVLEKPKETLSDLPRRSRAPRMSAQRARNSS